MTIKGNIVDILNKQIFVGTIEVADEKISAIIKLHDAIDERYPYIMPGFIDSHVHVESSMLIPSEFAKLAVIHGTTGTISDPHEIANVCGVAGVQFMIDNGKTVPFKFHFGAPSCVPATVFETAGAAIDSDAVATLLANDDIFYLSEMMNFPGVLNNDAEVLKKIAAAKKINKPIDGHAPGLRGALAKQYIDAGMSTDHECFTADEALDKLQYGMKILIREGSAAKNFDALIDLMHEHYENMMFCSDDKHPDSLATNHINALCARAVAKGIDIFKVLQAACVNPVLHYNMTNGLLRVGDAADFIVVKNLLNFEVNETFINGTLVASDGSSFIPTIPITPINQFNCSLKKETDFKVALKDGQQYIHVIEALEGQLITNKLTLPVFAHKGFIESNVANDILKIVVVNRYNDAPIAISFIKNIGLTNGAIASSVAHDSHNIVAVGVDDESICEAVNLVIKAQGGISAVSENKEMVLPLPIAGLMSADDGFKVAHDYTTINNFATNELGSTMAAPFMTLSFMALLVIPQLKLSDKGLFDGNSFFFIENGL
ncbi:adenine deaminase [Ferruginibacter yonginensis]|uniref:Adenine deaminase n=1 Tax=Ferruginibacter yonginensis TaxID=1310416 RepID=A0ABV8QTR6_9BACT